MGQHLITSFSKHSPRVPCHYWQMIKIYPIKILKQEPMKSHYYASRFRVPWRRSRSLWWIPVSISTTCLTIKRESGVNATKPALMFRCRSPTLHSPPPVNCYRHLHCRSKILLLHQRHLSTFCSWPGFVAPARLLVFASRCMIWRFFVMPTTPMLSAKGSGTTI